MKIVGRISLKSLALGGCALSVLGAASAVQAESYTIAPQDLKGALKEFAEQGDQQVLFSTDIVAGKRTGGFIGDATPEGVLGTLLAGTDLTYRKTGEGALLVVSAQEGGSGPQSAGAGGDVDALIVTAQKREENIQDVPIAISAFSQEELTTRQVAGGPDLMTQVPNMTFTKTNFSSYSIQIRGIGTQAISATTDAAVAVAFNNTPFIRNRFFEQEFYDLQRVEVLRGPQGTLYGRNATAGVVNIISAKPSFRYEARASADVANYKSTRVEGMLNLPLVDDKVALRLAGAWTKRDGYVTNEITGNPIDGRDLWSSRVSLRFEPTDGISANLIWEHFEEDDDRLRSGKQLCKTHEVTEVGGIAVTHYQGLSDTSGNGGALFSGVQATFSQGCAPASLYAPESFQTPNGVSLPYYLPLGALGLPTALDDPYVSRTQSTDLRVIESTVDPEYKARSELAELQLNVDVAEGLTLTSETAYSTDTLFSTQDYNRFNTAPGAWDLPTPGSLFDRAGVLTAGPNGGIFCDPQIGCTDRLVAIDVSTAKSRQFSQEFRLGSDFDGPFNFSLGANFLRYDTEDKYYVFVNSLSMIAAVSPYVNVDLPEYVAGVTDNTDCLDIVPPDPAHIGGVGYCTYIDPNSIHNLNDMGHNYFLSKNPYKLISYAVFGEAYYNITDSLKVTGGLRWTVDKKEAPRIPSWVIVDRSVGYPITDVIEQEWREPTGRLTIDWKPDLSFTDETLLYGSFAHGYKAGGANPPPTGPAMYCGNCGDDNTSLSSALIARSATHPKTFEPEFVNAFEVGTKNTLLDGRVTLNLAAFYYDYTGYQISYIVNRSAVNLNFDAEVWGLEIEADWRPLENLRLGFKGGYENTRVADGMKAIDLMDRTAGHEGWIVTKPFPTFPSNCIFPADLFIGEYEGNPFVYNIGGVGGGHAGGCDLAYTLGLDPITGLAYVPNPTLVSSTFLNSLALHPGYEGFNPLDPEINNGEGFAKDLSGNELPNAPHFTATITADYTLPLPNDWLMTLHTDLYYQSEAWTRIFNMPGYDKLKAYNNINFAAIFTNEEAGWRVMAYVKNVLDRDSITGAFLNSDDSGLTTNVFLTEPRLYGVRVTKDWTGEGWWTGANPDHPAGQPYPLAVEIGGQVQRHDGAYDTVSPSFIGAFSDTLNLAESAQHQDLDWGDGRDVRLTWRPDNSPWRISGGVRFGKTNAGARLSATEASEPVCAFGGDYAFICDTKYDDPDYGPFTQISQTNSATASLREHEEHRIIDLVVGRDIGLGALSRSTFGLGVRGVRLESATDLNFLGINWDIPEGFALPFPGLLSTRTTYGATLSSRREFEGVGPVLSWDASAPLIDREDLGRVSVDWSVTGGVFYGDQQTASTGSESVGENEIGAAAMIFQTWGPTTVPPVVTAVGIPARSKSATVPGVDLSLGLSYEIQRVKVGAGYRWERYFDALDVGYDEAKKADRTIDGPYFKVSVGFGG